MAPGTEFAYDFCAGIGPLQLGIVLCDILIPFHSQIWVKDIALMHDE